MKFVSAVEIPYLERDRADRLHAELIQRVATTTSSAPAPFGGEYPSTDL